MPRRPQRWVAARETKLLSQSHQPVTSDTSPREAASRQHLPAGECGYSRELHGLGQLRIDAPSDNGRDSLVSSPGLAEYPRAASAVLLRFCHGVLPA